MGSMGAGLEYMGFVFMKYMFRQSTYDSGFFYKKTLRWSEMVSAEGDYRFYDM